MIELSSLIKKTNAYKIISGDKKANRLSHAYLILTSDKQMLSGYLKYFAKIIACDCQEPCLECRVCSLIESNSHPDVIFYPKNKESISSDEVNELIEESFLRPIECDKKVFVLLNAELMNASAQNKLLKTLEEPPKNVHILLGATSEFQLLSTIKSRVRKLEIPAFDNQTVIDALKNDCTDIEKLKTAVFCSDGSVGNALSLYNDEKLSYTTDLVVDVLVNMSSSSQVLRYSTKILKSNIDISQFLSVLELLLRDMLVLSQGQEQLVNNKQLKEKLKNAQKFNTGAILYALDTVIKAGQRKKFNMTPTMLIEWVLFQILEGKYKWQKF